MTDFAHRSTQSAKDGRSFSQLLDEAGFYEENIIGKVVTGTVVRVEEENVFVNIGLRSEGIVPLKEFVDENGNCEVREGAEVDILIKSAGRGIPKVSKTEADGIKCAERLNEMFANGEPVKVFALKRIKGGVECRVEISGKKAFLPSSHVQIGRERNHNSDKIIGRSFDALIIEMDRKRVVLSRRKLLEKERKAKRAEFVKGIEVGTLVKGVVSNTIGSGAFVDLTDGSGVVEGFIPIREISWKRIKTPSDVLTAGQEIEVKVIGIENNGERIGLSYKHTQLNPWEEFAQNTSPNSRIIGKITNVNKVGVFIEVAEGVVGLLHSDNISWKGTVDPVDEYGVSSKGKEIEVVMLRCIPEKKKMSLGVKQLQKDPWKTAVKKLKKGETVMTGKVKKEDRGGLVLELEDDIDGFIRFSDLGGSDNREEGGHYKTGSEITGVVKNVDNEMRRVSLSRVLLNRKNEREILREFNSKQGDGESVKLGDLMVGKIGIGADGE